MVSATSGCLISGLAIFLFLFAGRRDVYHLSCLGCVVSLGCPGDKKRSNTIIQVNKIKIYRLQKLNQLANQSCFLVKATPLDSIHYSSVELSKKEVRFRSLTKKSDSDLDHLKQVLLRISFDGKSNG